MVVFFQEVSAGLDFFIRVIYWLLKLLSHSLTVYPLFTPLLLMGTAISFFLFVSRVIKRNLL